MIPALDPQEFTLASRLVFARFDGRSPCFGFHGQLATDVLLSVMTQVNWDGLQTHAFLERFVALGELALQDLARDRLLSTRADGQEEMTLDAVRRAAVFPLFSADIGFDVQAFLNLASQ